MRRNDLGAVAEVDLVAVVGGWVVRRGDHDPAAASSSVIDQASTGVGDPLVEQSRRDSDRGHHPCGVEREDIALATGVVADHHPAPAGLGIALEQILRQSGGGLLHDQPVHAHRARPDRRPQAGRSELETTGEAVASSAGLGVDQGVQLVSDVVVGFGRQPTLGGGIATRRWSHRPAYAARPAAGDPRGRSPRRPRSIRSGRTR